MERTKENEIFAVIFQLKQLKRRPQKIQAPTGFEPMTIFFLPHPHRGADSKAIFTRVHKSSENVLPKRGLHAG